MVWQFSLVEGQARVVNGGSRLERNEDGNVLR